MSIIRLTFHAPTGTRVDITDPSVDAYGMDCIWHNMYAESTGFTTFRKWFRLDVNEMLMRVAKHVEMGVYQIISVNASTHSLVVVCISDKTIHEFPEGPLIG